MKAEHKNYYTVMAVPYDMPVVGYKSRCPATLRLWSARAKDRFDLKSFNSGDYMQAMQEREAAEVISKVLYPDDSHEQGKQLRLKQFYFMTSATMQNLVRTHKERHGDLHSLPNYVAVQINDTHPTLAMPELMRILMDEENYTWEEAYNIVSRMFNYTNHTIMAEALECWEEGMFKTLLPRIYSIVQELNQRYCEKLNRYYPGDMDRISNMAIVAYGQIRMANLCVAVARRVNGVSQLHGAILKNDLFADSYKIYPQKYLAITNGITHRRWLAVANPALTKLMTETIGDGFIKDYRQFDKLMEYTEDEAFLEKFAAVKQQNKQRLADYLLKKQGIEVNVNSIFDVQAKRLHEYKRQLLKCLHILYLYNSLQQNPDAVTTPITFFFAAKAAPGYARAKSIIRLINTIGELVNNDPATKGKLQVVFIENYERLLGRGADPRHRHQRAALHRRVGGVGHRQHEVHDERGRDHRHHGRGQRGDLRPGRAGEHLHLRGQRQRDQDHADLQDLPARRVLREKPRRARRPGPPHRRHPAGGLGPPLLRPLPVAALRRLRRGRQVLCPPRPALLHRQVRAGLQKVLHRPQGLAEDGRHQHRQVGGVQQRPHHHRVQRQDLEAGKTEVKAGRI